MTNNILYRIYFWRDGVTLKRFIQAILNRGRTIILTTIAAISGMLPFLLDGPNEIFWFSLAIGTIGGLVFSVFAIFVGLPVLLWKRNF